MSNIPVWALGYGLRAAGVPCAEEVAMMLGRKKPDPVLKLETDFLAFEGIAGGGIQYSGSYGGTYPVPKPYTSSFEKGKFPTRLSYIYDMYGYKNYVNIGQGTIAIVLENAADVLQTKVGNRIVVRYILPYQLSGNLHSEVTSGYGADPKYYTIDFYLDSASVSEVEKTARYKISQRIDQNSALNWTPHEPTGNNVNDSVYCPMLKNAGLKTITDEDGIIGWELEGELLHPVEKILIDITGHFSSTNRCLGVYARCKKDDLQVSIYE